MQQGTLPADEILQELQRLIEGKLMILPYANEVVESSFGYPQGLRDRNADEQIASLQEHLPGLMFSDEVIKEVKRLYGQPQLDGAESKKVIPDYREVARYAKSDLAGMSEMEVYCLALQVVIKKLQKLHGKKFHNYREGALTPSHLQLLEKTSSAHSVLRETQGGIWVVDSQFGKRWAGRSVRHAQVRFDDNEFGWGPYEIGIQLLTHPDRITDSDQLYIDCAGVEYSPSASGDFFAGLDFYWNNFNGLLELNDYRTGHTNGQWGSASAFLPPATAKG